MFKTIIKERRLELGLTMREVAMASGVSEATVSRWESGNIENTRGDKLRLLARALNLDPLELMGEEESYVPQYKNIEALPQTYKIPLVGAIACGAPILAEENIEEYVELPTSVHADFCLRCHGDSMIGARIMDGDIVFVRSSTVAENGKIAVVLLGNEATLKRLYVYDDSVVLAAENPVYKPIIVKGEKLETLRIQGVAVAFISAVI